MVDKKEYLESLVDDELQKFIIANLDKDPKELLELVIKHMNGE